MAEYLASNNASTTLATASINATATSFTVASGQGDRFPSPSGGSYTLICFENGSTREIMCIVGRSTDTMTVGIPGSASANVAGRNYESILGMTAATWTSGAVISCRATAALLVLGANASANLPATIHAATAKTPVVDADEVVLVDSAASWVIKKFTLTTLWTWIQTHLASPGAIGATTAATLRGTTVESTIATGTAPFIVASTTEVANLKAATSTTADSATKSGIPQNSQSAAYTTVLADANKHLLHPTADNNARTFTIDSNANVAYVVGTTLTFVNQINTLTIAITSDTLTLAGIGTTGSRTLNSSGMATAIKIEATKWVISGSGLS